MKLHRFHKIDGNFKRTLKGKVRRTPFQILQTMAIPTLLHGSETLALADQFRRIEATEIITEYRQNW